MHRGHEFFLREAKKLGTELVVVVAQDENVRKIKNKIPHDNAKLRQEKVAKLSFADKVLIGHATDFEKILQAEKPDILALGYDQKIPEEIDNFARKYPQIEIRKIQSHKPEIYKTTLLSKK